MIDNPPGEHTNVNLQYSLLCLGYDETKGPPIFQFVVRELVVDRIPYQFPEQAGIFWINGWLADGESKPRRQGLRLIAPDGREVFRHESELEGATCTSVTFLQGLEVEQAGDFRFEVSLDGELRIGYPFPVVLAET